MYFTPNRDNMTSQEIVTELMRKGFDCIKDTKRNLYILYNRYSLFYSNSIFEEGISLVKLRTWYKGNPNDKYIDSNCTNGEALNRINILENVINSIINSSNPKEIFDYLPYTKSNKFSKTGAINLFIPNIKSTYSGEYFSQTEIALQLRPLEIMPSKGFSFTGIKSDEICILEINPRASFTNKKTPENIIDENGKFKMINTPIRNKYLKQEDLIPGSSYIDAKGSEYLYIGIVNYNIYFEDIDKSTGKSYNNTLSNNELKYLYLRVTSNVKKKLLKCNNFSEFLYDRFEESLQKELFGWDKGLNITESKKFISLKTIYFDSTHNETKKEFVINQAKGTIKYYPDRMVKTTIKVN